MPTVLVLSRRQLAGLAGRPWLHHRRSHLRQSCCACLGGLPESTIQVLCFSVENEARVWHLSSVQVADRSCCTRFGPRAFSGWSFPLGIPTSSSSQKLLHRETVNLPAVFAVAGDESKVLTHPTHAFELSILPQDLEYFSDVCPSGYLAHNNTFCRHSAYDVVDIDCTDVSIWVLQSFLIASQHCVDRF